MSILALPPTRGLGWHLPDAARQAEELRIDDARVRLHTLSTPLDAARPDALKLTRPLRASVVVVAVTSVGKVTDPEVRGLARLWNQSTTDDNIPAAAPAIPARDVHRHRAHFEPGHARAGVQEWSCLYSYLAILKQAACTQGGSPCHLGLRLVALPLCRLHPRDTIVSQSVQYVSRHPPHRPTARGSRGECLGLTMAPLALTEHADQVSASIALVSATHSERTDKALTAEQQLSLIATGAFLIWTATLYILSHSKASCREWAKSRITFLSTPFGVSRPLDWATFALTPHRVGPVRQLDGRRRHRRVGMDYRM